MTLRILHTADWQLGKPFHNVPGDAGALLREARFEAVRRIADLAARYEVAAVLVAGDVFDSNLAADRTVLQALAAMRAFQGPWILLPGNHDAALAESVWTRFERLGCPPGCRIARMPEPVTLADGRLVVLPAPLTERHTLDDLTAWMDEARTPAGAVRVGLAHGSVAGRLPDAADAPNPIAADRAVTARLDYLALGDWHGALEIAPRTWYAGTPEPDRFKDNGAGHVLLVEIEGPGAVPRVTRLPVASYVWQDLVVDLTATDAGDDPAGRIDRALTTTSRPERRIVRLTLRGAVDLAGRLAVEAALERWRGELCHLELEDELVAEPSERDLLQLGDAPVIGRAARELSSLVRAGDAEERTAAALALRFLYLEAGRLERRR
ncbi:metallophosphoesterase family protein [Benzoatithermus flavus]|uniref:DNA repair exonuclease n=1 Tax=Benzoatithermus flavus TaxID=3108223 RepID=A0ABU8XLQ3_9PROT